MKKVTFFFLLYFVMMRTSQVYAQQFTVKYDSLLTTFKIQNKKEIQGSSDLEAHYAQRKEEELRYILDEFFKTTQYRKVQSIEVTQYLINAVMVKDKHPVDSFWSVVYILNIPDAVAYNEKLKADSFLNVKAGPTKVPESYCIATLDDKRLILVSVRSYLYKDYNEMVQKRERINQYLAWVRQKYQ